MNEEEAHNYMYQLFMLTLKQNVSSCNCIMAATFTFTIFDVEEYQHSMTK